MTRPTSTVAEGAARTRTPAQAYRRFGEVDAAGTSLLYERVAIAMSESDDARRAIESMPARTRHPASVLAALHDLALAGRAPALAAAYAAADPDAAAGAAIEALVRMTDAVAATAARRPVQTYEIQRAAVLRPAIAEGARRVGADRVALIVVGGSPGIDLDVDGVAIAYDDGRSLGDPSSPVRVSCSVKGVRAIPAQPMPEVVTRIRIGPDPVDVTDEDDTRWLRACVWPDQLQASAQLDAALAVAAAAPPLLLPGDPVEGLPDALTRVPAGILPLVTTTWALSSFSPERRLQFLNALDAAATDRTVAWVSVEGVGVAPAIPTLGDRPASGHSIVGLATFEHATTRADAIGRCWSRGRWMSWLTDR